MEVGRRCVKYALPTVTFACDLIVACVLAFVHWCSCKFDVCHQRTPVPSVHKGESSVSIHIWGLKTPLGEDSSKVLTELIPRTVCHVFGECCD